MATPDITRFLKQPGKQYVGARLQQGRILGDADFNEGVWLREEDRRRALLDFVGVRGAPDFGFSICQPFPNPTVPPPVAIPLAPQDELQQASFTFDGDGDETSLLPLSIQKGAFYLGGMRFEMDAPESFMFQRDFLQMKSADIPTLPAAGDVGQTLYFLNAWEQDVGVVEDPEFREPALGGSETSVRVRRMRRVEAVNTDALDCATAFTNAMAEIAGPNASFDPVTGELVSTGTLRLTFDPAAANPSCSDCNPPQSGAYLGADNQTIRIMLTDADHFVWAFDNAAPLYRARISNILASPLDPAGVKITLVTPPADEEHFPLVNRVVEILPFAALLDGSDNPSATADPAFNKAPAEIGAFTRVVEAYDPGTQSFRVDPFQGIPEAAAFVHQWDPNHPDHDRLNVVPSTGDPTDQFVYVRFWHQATSHAGVDTQLAIDADGTGPILDPTGVQPIFPSPGRAGDFWVAAVRPETPNPIIPIDLQQSPNGMPPDGPRHFYAPLTLVQVTTTGEEGTTEVVDAVSDCRRLVRPTGDDECSTVTVGACFGSAGDFNSINDAIAALPSDGGVVTIRPGLYRERVVIDRPGVILEGCGENTVLMSPDNGDGFTVNAVIRLHGDCHGSRVRSMRIEASEESAIIADGATDIGFAALHIIGRVTEVGSSSSSSSTTNASTDAPLIVLTSCDTITFQAIQIDAQRRPGMLMDGCEGLRAESMSLEGAFDTFAAPAGPMITINACTGFKMRDIGIQTFGQVGVSVTGQVPPSRDIELERLTIVSGFSSVAPVVPPLSGVDIVFGFNVRLSQSRITMAGLTKDATLQSPFSPFAAVVALGNEIWIEDNHIEALQNDSQGPRPGPAAWGGIQLRGSSTGVVVRGNRIIGGIGHGITLGSVSWVDVNDFNNTRTNLGAGKLLIVDQGFDAGWVVSGDFSSFSDDRIDEFHAVDEGQLSDVAILNNRIEQMSTNGISVLSVLGLPEVFSDETDRALPQVVRIRIDGNVITRNVVRPQKQQPGATFRENLVTEADPRSPVGAAIQSLPLGGIVLATVTDTADIRNNLISGNGLTTVTAAVNGIFILNGEGISIYGNRIQSNGSVASSSSVPDRGVRAGIAIMLAGTGAPASFDLLQEVLFEGGNDLPSDGSSVRIVDNFVTQQEGRAVHVIAAGPVAISGNFLSSAGFHGSDSPEDVFAIGDVVLVEDIGGPWERFDIDDVPHTTGDPPVFTDHVGPMQFARYLLNAVVSSPRFFTGVGGQVLFQNNQVIYDWNIVRTPPASGPLGIFPVALMTLDHLSITGNHLALHISNFTTDPPPPPPDPGLVGTDVRSTPMLAHLFAAGGTVQISANRVAGSVADTLLSIWALGEMATEVTANQTSLANFFRTNKGGPLVPAATITDPAEQTPDNQVMFFEPVVDEGFGFFTTNLHLFFQLLFRPASMGVPPGPPG